MATSSSTDFSLNARGVITFALQLLRRAPAEGTGVSGIHARNAKRDLNLMMKSWQVSGPHLARETFGSVSLANATSSYALSPRPYRLIEARYRNTSGIDIPMLEMTRQEYVDLPNKSSSGIPTSYYLDIQRDAVNLYVWPVKATVTTETIQYSYQRIFEDIDSLDNDIDVPQEWLETIGYCLADRMQSSFGTKDDRLTARAESLLAEAKAADRENFFDVMPDWNY